MRLQILPTFLLRDSKEQLVILTFTCFQVVKHALLSSDAVACAQQILLSRGGRNKAEIEEFIQSVADAYIIELLQKKQMDTAKDVLRNTVCNIFHFKMRLSECYR